MRNGWKWLVLLLIVALAAALLAGWTWDEGSIW